MPPLYRPTYERGNCGIGFVANRLGRPSHELLNLAVESLVNLQHRGALDAEARTGDGAGLLTSLPTRLFAREAERLTGRGVDAARLGVGVFFLQPGTEAEAMALAEAALKRYHLALLAWREVPTDNDILGEQARSTLPALWHALVTPAAGTEMKLEHRLYLARKAFQRAAAALGAYVPSFSSRTIVYKGLLLAPQLAQFYLDLIDPDYEVQVAVFHQRYSTNTLPTWQNAQPFRVL